MKKRVVIAICCLLVMALVFTGCAQAPTETKADAQGSSDAADTQDGQAAEEQKDDGEAAAEDVPAQDTITAEVPEGGNVEAVGNADEPLRIAFLSFQNNPFWYPIRDGANAAKEYLANYNTTVDYIVMGEELTPEKVTAGIDAAIAKEYDGICVVPVFDGTEIFIDKAVDAGIPVINFCAEGSKESKRLFLYGQNAYKAGQLAGEIIEDYTGAEGKIGVITGVLGATQHENRKNGALDYIDENCPNIEVVGVFENKDKAETAYSQTQDMLTANPDLKLVYVTAGGPFGAAKAIQDAGLTGKVGVVCYDHIDDNLKYVKSGEVIAAIDQDPFGMGFDSCVYMHNYLTTGEKPEGTFVEVDLGVVTPDNISELYPNFE